MTVDRTPVEVAVIDAITASMDEPDALSEARGLIRSLATQGWVILADEPDHYVTFDEDGWFIEHSVECRLAVTLGTCSYNKAVREVADEPDADQFGRWRITSIDDEGLPSLERVS